MSGARPRVDGAKVPGSPCLIEEEVSRRPPPGCYGMDSAPKDRRILILNQILHWKGHAQGYQPSGEAWVECWWDVGEWREWRGSKTARTTATITPLMWAEVP